jgi:hypothetical protein
MLLGIGRKQQQLNDVLCAVRAIANSNNKNVGGGVSYTVRAKATYAVDLVSRGGLH